MPPEAGMPRQPLGRSGLDVSRLALGSWRTFERIPREDGLAVMRAAREHGFNFLDDARYDDETGTAPPAGLEYDAGQSGRASDRLDDPRYQAARELGRRLREVGSELGVSPVALAVAFALANPVVSSVLFGATSPAQIAENVAGLTVDPGIIERVLAL